MLITMTRDQFADIINTQATELSDYTVGFVLTHVEKNIEGGALGGSGTLVSIDGVDGILTAEHVLRNFRQLKNVGLILFGNPIGKIHRLVFDPSICREISIAPTGTPDTGPDLGFLVLPPDKTAAVRARKSFYNLSKRRGGMLEQPPSRELGMWTICGLAEEWTADAPGQQNFHTIKVFNGKLLGPLDASEWRDGGDYDYVDFEVPHGDSDAPHSFEGYSGGAIWQVIIKPDDAGVPKVTDRHLLGVAYYQSGAIERNGKTIREITCHGRVSVYKTLIDTVRAELSSN